MRSGQQPFYGKASLICGDPNSPKCLTIPKNIKALRKKI